MKNPQKIVAIGGGEIGRPGHSIETERIDKEIIRLTGKRHPQVLFIPTASGDNERYYQTVQQYFGKRLGCKTEVLYLIKEKPSKKGIEEKIFGADAVYVGGGNTSRMLKIWRRYGVDTILQKAAQQGVVLSGLSAGAICWFKYGESDAPKFALPKSKKLIRIKCLGLIDGMACPHYDVERNRRPYLRRMIKERGGMAIALENCSALEVKGGQFRVIASLGAANVYKIFRKQMRVIEEKLPKDWKFRPLKELFQIDGYSG